MANDCFRTERNLRKNALHYLWVMCQMPYLLRYYRPLQHCLRKELCILFGNTISPVPCGWLAAGRHSNIC